MSTGRAVALAVAAGLGGLLGHVGAKWAVTRDWSRTAGVLRAWVPGEPVGEGDLFTETQAQEVIRRLEACEQHVIELGELRNVVNQHEADLRRMSHA